MANTTTQVTLDQLHQAILDGIRAQFPDLVTVEDYPEDRKALLPAQLPACLVEMTELEASPEDDPGTEQLAAYAGFEARFIIGFRTPKAKRAIRERVAQFLLGLRHQRWGLPIAPAIPARAYEDPFSPDMDQYEVWAVEWRHLIHLGATVWTDEGEIPTQVLVGYAPEIGIDHVDDYEPLQGVPQA
jgi:hypothetical protein